MRYKMQAGGWMGAVLASLLPAVVHAQTPPKEPPSESSPDEPPSAEPSAEQAPTTIERARARFIRGTELYQGGDFKLALIEFERAYALNPNFKILYNIGQVNMQLNSYAAALKAFERYVADGGDEIDATRREAIDAELPELYARTGRMSVTCNLEGAEVRLSGRPVGTTPLFGLIVDAGNHTISVWKDGRSASQFVTVAGKDVVDLELNIVVPEPEPVVVPPPVVNPSPDPPPPLPLPIIQPEQGRNDAWVAGWAVTGGLTAAAIVTGAFALDAQSAHREELGLETNEDQLDKTASRALNLSIATDVLVGSAIVGAAVSTLFTVIALTAEDDAVSVALSPTGALVHARF